MRRQVAFILGVLFAGMTVNVLLAWACVLWSPLSPFDSNYKHAVVLSFAPKNPGIDETWYLPEDVLHGFGVQFMDGFLDYRVYPRNMNHNIRRQIGRIRAGFPLLSVEAQVNHDHMGPGYPVPPARFAHAKPRSNDGILLPNQSVSMGYFGLPKALPLRPMWLCFVINSLLYAAILAAPMVIRRYSRFRRRLCLRCGYPIGQSAVCTECGQLIKRAVDRAATN